MIHVLEAERLSKHFRGVTAVNGVDLALGEGELLGLFGPNGAGKTTVFNVIAGALVPDEGRVRLRGRDITALPAFRRARLGIGRTFQVVRPFRGLSVLDNVLASVPSAGAAGAHGVAEALELLDHVGLADRADAPARELTLGMLKRLEVARALALVPCVLLLDEPLAGLTTREAGELLRFIGSLKRTTSVVMVEHNVRLALPICDRAVVMDAGAVIAEGPPAEIRTNPAVISAYLGEPTDGDATAGD